MADLESFRKRLHYYISSVTIPRGPKVGRATQSKLAHEIIMDPGDLSKRLHGRIAFSCDEVQRIIETLAKWGAIKTQDQAVELLDLTGCEHFSQAQWKAKPLNELAHSSDESTPIAPNPNRVIDKQPTRFITHLLRNKSVVFVVLLLLLILIGGILFFILQSLPTADSQIKSVIRSYCLALQIGNYGTAYDLFSKSRKNKETELQFVSNQPKSGRITKCLIKHLPQHGSTTAFCICIFVKSDKTEETFCIQFILENNDWKIDDIAPSLG